MTTPDLKPCPFCGGKAYTSKWYYGWSVYAWHEDDCFLTEAITTSYEVETEAIDAWNRRANDESV